MVSALVNLEKHAVLEASAGTGKTYTLEGLVLRLLTEKACRIDQVLLVTYTEKATGELKGRLRERLEKSCTDRQDDRYEVLRAALEQFDQTSIFTIHGFCQRVLQEFAFEQRQDFRPRLVHDRPLLRSSLREIQRRDWWQRYGPQLRTVLELANYQGKAGERWDRLVLTIAERLRPACAQRLVPEPLHDWLEQLPNIEDRIREQVRWVREQAGGIREPVQQHRWYTGYGRISNRWRMQRRGEFIVPLLHWLASPDAEERPLASFVRLALVTIDRSRSFEIALQKLSADDLAVLQEHCSDLPMALSIMQKLREQIDCPLHASQLAAHTVAQLQQHLSDVKRERGLQSFEDMIVRVHEGLDPQRNPAADRLVQLLRERYRYAIVDEFQDTDPLQWQIFRRIFVEGNETRLFVVGDPKQAIFAFRGADLPTYLTAIEQLKTDHAADTHELTINWRSTAEMLHALNHLFDRSTWFGKELRYTRVAPPPDEQRQIEILRDDSGRAALSIIEVAAKKLSQARRSFAQFISGEICRLLAGPALEFTHKVKRRTLDASDICVLVWKRAEAVPVIDAFKRAGIPFSFYKQTGLWQSEQAVHLGYVLRALSRPEEAESFRKALLTRFFRFRPEALTGADGWPVHHAARELFQHWVNLAERRQWGRLFQSLLDDSGLIFFEAEQMDGDRRLANYRHIFAALEQAAYAQNLDLFELLEVFEQKYRQVDEEAELQPIETEQPRVRIMTIHAAKGLEFPVVFLAGGFTQRPVTGDVHRDDGGRVVYNLAPSEESKIRARAERQAEDRRLLYVALTRAMIKLYVPAPNVERQNSPGPIIHILQPALAAAQVAELGAPWAAIDFAPLAPDPALRSKENDADPKALIAHELFPRVDDDLRRRRIFIRSFSSLHREKGSHAVEAASFGDAPQREVDDEPVAPQAADALRGPVFGDIVHNVLEGLDFALVGAAAEPAALNRPGHPFRVLLDEELRKNALNLPSRINRTALDEACRQLVAELVWKTLRTPLQALGCALWQVPKADLLPEVEFHFPEIFGDDLPPGLQREEGFITGFMDLVLRHKGRYFLFDWKTNLLPGYSSADVARSMQESDYVRQYRLYVHALRRWLERVQRGFNFERDFGGVYYLYLRGLNGVDESSGVHFCRPTADELTMAVLLQ